MDDMEDVRNALIDVETAVEKQTRVLEEIRDLLKIAARPRAIILPAGVEVSDLDDETLRGMAEALGLI